MARPSVLAAVPVRVKFAHVPGPLKRQSAPTPLIMMLVPLQFFFPSPPEPVFPVRVITAVLAVIVTFDAEPDTERAAVADPVNDSAIADAPKVTARTPDPAGIDSCPHEQVCPFVFNVPAVNVIAPVNVVPALCRSVRSDLLMVMEAAERATSTVTVAVVPELESKSTVSPATGTVWPPAPPVVADQCAVSLVLPVPPTQKRLAMVTSFGGQVTGYSGQVTENH